MMSRLSASVPLLLLALVVCSGCKHRPQADPYATDNMYHWMSWDVYEAWAKIPVFETEQALEVIYDDAEEDSWRRLMVFQLFENLVRPGWTSRDFGALFKDPSWIEEAEVRHLFGGTGLSTVDLDNEEIKMIFLLIPFAENRGSDPGAITIGLGGMERPRSDQADEVARAFLRGDLESEGAYIVEFAMSHPDRLSGCIERFAKRGHGLMPWR